MATTFKHKVGNLGGTFSSSVDADLDNIHVKELPRIEFGDIDTTIRVKELPRIDFGEFNTNIRVKELPKIEIDANTNSAVNVAITRIPDVRAHLPSHYNLGVSVFGVELFSFSLCGESQVITEEFVPRRMETCK